MLNPQKFRKEAFEITAIQWNGTASNATPIINWVHSKEDSLANFLCSDPNRCHEFNGDVPHSIFVRDGVKTFSLGPGDWLIQDFSGEFHKISQHQFEPVNSYEPHFQPVE